MKLKFALLALTLTAAPMIAQAANECRMATQHVAYMGDVVEGMAVICPHDGNWRVVSFRDRQGHDLPMPGQFLYPEPPMILTAPQYAFVPRQVIYSMPPPRVTFYEQ
jgi:hypothetical protein